MKLKKHVMGNFLTSTGLGIFLLLLAIGIFGPLLVGKTGLTPNLEMHLKSPAMGGRLGYGVNGIDVLAWIIHGARTSLIISFFVTAISVIVGTTIGAVSGFFGGLVDDVMMRIVDIILSFPGILLALYLAAVLPPSIFTLMFALCVTGWVTYARLVRARVLEVKNREFVVAATALGASNFRIIARHILPNVMGPVIVQASYGISVIILAEAGLTFLGLGLPVGTPSWGALLDQGVANLFTSPYLAIFPGICIAISVLGFNFLGDGLRDFLDPKAR